MFLAPAPPPPPDTTTRVAVAALCVIWLLAGAVGHDPWKFDDALHLGIAYGMSNGSWLVPQLAGEPWLLNPPLYYWLANLFGSLLGQWLPWHDAARLASTALSAAMLLSLYGAGRKLGGPVAALLAPILAVGTLGLVAPLHDAQPAVAGVAGGAIALYALTLLPTRALAGGMALGIGFSVAFLGAGLDGLAPSLICALLIGLHPHWRNQHSLVGGLLALVIAACLCLPWPIHLLDSAPGLAATWWANELAAVTPRRLPGWNHLELLGWAAWPLWPLVLWLLWNQRRRLAEPALFLPALASAIGLIIFLCDDSRATALLPALAPMALLAAQAVAALRRGAANAFDWFGMITFSLLAGLLWLGGFAILTGTPERVAKNFSKPAPGFIADPSIPGITLAIAATVAWLVIMLRMPRTAWRAALRWSAGAACAWILLCCLWLPWIDYGKSYRSTALALRAALPNDTKQCIERRSLGASQRASLDYFAGIRTVSRRNAQDCRYLIVQATPLADKAIPGWLLVTEVSRPGDKSERLRLYRR